MEKPNALALELAGFPDLEYYEHLTFHAWNASLILAEQTSGCDMEVLVELVVVVVAWKVETLATHSFELVILACDLEHWT